MMPSEHPRMGCPYRDEDMGHRGGPEGPPIGLIMAPNGVPNGSQMGPYLLEKGFWASLETRQK